MKKLSMKLATVCCCITLLTSCNVDNSDNPVKPTDSEQPAAYTILYYGHGGGNREYYYLQKIADFYNASPDALKRVNVVAQYKFSTTDNLYKQGYFSDDSSIDSCQLYGSKTIRWALDPAKTFKEQAYAPASIYGADNADHTSPDSLASFINWAVKNYPAQKYMLIVHDHGGGYTPDGELPEAKPAAAARRSLVGDDGNIGHCFTAKSFRRALTTANVRFETIFMDACLMNNLEYQFELHDLCDYVIAPTYSKPSIDGAYRMIPQVLCQPMVDIEKALDAYCKACVNSWDVAFGTETDDTTPNYTDMTVTRTASIPQLGKMLREFTDRLCNTYTNGTDAQRAAIDDCTARATKVQLNQANYDAVKYVRSIITALPEVYGDDFYNQMKEAFNNCILAQYFSHYLTVHEYMVDYSVLLGAEGSYVYIYWKDNLYADSKEPYAAEFYDDNGDMQLYKLTPTENPEYYSAEPNGNVSYWGSTLAETYEQLAFDRVVGWSRWLRLNKQWPNMFCPKDMNFELPMPKTEDF
jgi:hypothetical protein